MIRRFAIVSSLVVLGSLGLSTVARAGEGGVAGSAAFTVNVDGKVTGVAVSAAVGKENAMAHAFNYDGSNSNGLQNSAFSLGTAGALSLNGLGDPAGFALNTIEDSARTVVQANPFSTGYSIQLGTVSPNILNKVL
ncbi:MAG TPA: hypothetical protein DDZ60_19820 [Planktothrix sp. UBA10369]|jgi:hypothetical protein|nr:hypothetical protein [Planktothrix sp. UBA10369]